MSPELDPFQFMVAVAVVYAIGAMILAVIWWRRPE